MNRHMLTMLLISSDAIVNSFHESTKREERAIDTEVDVSMDSGADPKVGEPVEVQKSEEQIYPTTLSPPVILGSSSRGAEFNFSLLRHFRTESHISSYDCVAYLSRNGN